MGTEPLGSVFTGEAGMLPEDDPLRSLISEVAIGMPSFYMPDPEMRWAPPRGIRDLVVRHSLPRQNVLPPSEVLFTETMTDGLWDVEEDFPLAGYNTPMGESTARWFAPLAHQMAVFPRGDSVVVVAAYDLPAHGVADSIRVDAGFALLPADGFLGDLRVIRADESEGTGVFAITTEAVPSFVSLELVVPEEGALARARYGIDLSPSPPGKPALSDILLLREGDLPESLPDAVGAARPSNRVLPGEEIAIYWELHGLDLLDLVEVPVSLVLHPPPPGGVGGFLRRIGEAIGLLNEIHPIRTTWMEEVGEGSFMGRSIGFRAPGADEGRYLIELRAELPGREPLITLREVEVTRSTIPTSRPRILIRRPLLTRSLGPCAPGSTGLRCLMNTMDPSIFGHYGGTLHTGTFGYDGW
jgi:hypothetical protein